ncbi:MAG: isochorismatase family protein [Planctomycetota bacterium]
MSESPRPRRDNTVLVVVDLQERLLPVMRERERLVARVGLAIDGARALGIPILATEQNPRGLGPTDPDLARRLEAPPLAKSTFSCFGAPGFAEALRDREAEVIALCGIESHICVQATALDALDRGYGVLLLEDAMSTRLGSTGPAGIARMRQEGARSSSAEGFLFEMMAGADDAAFRSILALVREVS